MVSEGGQLDVRRAYDVEDARDMTSSSSSLFSRAACCVVSSSVFGVDRQVKGVSVAPDGVNPEVFRAHKLLLRSKPLEAIRSEIGEVRRRVTALSVPSGMFRSGTYLGPVSLVNGRAKLFDELVPSFLATYDAVAEDGRRALGPLARLRDYPSAERVRSSFDLSWQYFTVSAPGSESGITAEIVERERQKAAEVWKDALAEGTAVLRAAMSDLVTHMVAKLTPGPDGARLIFRDSMVGNVREFLATFSARNLAGDGELDRLAAEAGRLLSGVSAESLRSSSSTRERVAEGMSVVKAALDAAIMAAPARRFSADE